MLFVKDLVQNALCMVCLTLTFATFLRWDLGSHRARVPYGRKRCLWSCASTAGESIPYTQRAIVCFLYTQTGEKWHDPGLQSNLELDLHRTRRGCGQLESHEAALAPGRTGRLRGHRSPPAWCSQAVPASAGGSVLLPPPLALLQLYDTCSLPLRGSPVKTTPP